MATTTPNFGWPVPTSTDLVKDGATAIEALGDAIDASLVDLEGGTTGQILAKASNTDMDFTWTTPNPGDITAVTAGTGITGGGTSGDVTVSFDQANYGGGQFASGKNKIINGDFRIWQRGTSITPVSAFGYGPDRWRTYSFGTSTSTLSQQTFTPGTAPVSGYEGQYFVRVASTNTLTYLSQPIEDVRTFAGQTVTVSFWAKSASAQTLSVLKIDQDFGSGGSTLVTTNGAALAITTSWARYSTTIALPSISGKTIGTSSFIDVVIRGAINNNLDIWGVQIEAGSTATPFQTASGSIQGELALCQRYYTRETVTTNYCYLKGFGNATTTTLARIIVPFAVQMRVKPTSMDKGASLAVSDGANLFSTGTFLLSTNSTTQSAQVEYTHGSAVFTQFRYYGLQDENTGATYLGFSAEL
jgi:hypothetical protein